MDWTIVSHCDIGDKYDKSPGKSVRCSFYFLRWSEDWIVLKSTGFGRTGFPT